MAALRRVVALLGLRAAAAAAAAVRSSGSVSGQGAAAGRPRRRWAAGVCVAAGGAAAAAAAAGLCWFGSRETRTRSSISGLLASIPAVVEAKEKERVSDLEDGDVYMSAHEHRFRVFSSVEYEGQLYMTPQNFIESVTTSQPRNKKPWRSLSKQELEKILTDTPPVWRGSSKLFRNLRERGIISYTEYLFLLCILTKPHAGFKIAFNMFDADGNQMVDKREFLVLQEIFRKKNEKKGRKGDAEKSAQLTMQLYGYQVAPMNSVCIQIIPPPPPPTSQCQSQCQSQSQSLSQSLSLSLSLFPVQSQCQSQSQS
ncbi:calcium uptake protein 3, mitochondrial-like [Nelusetta ayraudi]|uniref:calcium uptake protein 3, mitochondrial-like n=1 Tax=Nelusetta ayraudi TaxID=303726 RepID=UPI003F6FF3EF